MRKLKTKLFPIDPKQLKQIKLMDEFEKENTVCTPIGTYEKESETSNDINIELVLEEKNKVQEICHLQGYKDIKSCTISFLPKNTRKRKIVSLAATYAMNTLGMEEVFLKINPEDKSLLEYLEGNEFECLGQEKDSIIFLVEKENE